MLYMIVIECLKFLLALSWQSQVIFITEDELDVEVIRVWMEDEDEGININDVSYSVF